MTDVLATVAGLLLLAVPALALPAALRIAGPARFAIAALVAAAGTVVAVFIALSLVDELTRGWILLGQVVVAALSLAAWVLAGRPAPARGYARAFREAARAAPGHPAVAVLAGLVVVALAVQLFMAIAVAPNNWDSMTYHLSRAAYWLQNHSATQFFPGTIRQNGAPPNAEMLQAWTMAITGTDRFAQVVQWLALVGLATAIYGGARLLGFARPAAVFAAALFAAMPQPILQATTTQNDLIVTFFIAAATLFAVSGLRSGSRGELAVAGAAAGLAIGTKGTAAVAAPSLGLLLAAAAWRYRPSAATVATAAALIVAGLAALASFNYALNVKNTDSLLGGAGARVNARERVVVPPRPGTSPVGAIALSGRGFRQKLVRDVWAFVDMPDVSMNWLSLAIERPTRALFRDVQQPNYFYFTVDHSVSEDGSAFGPVGFLLFLPLLVYMALRLRAPPARRLVALAALLYLLVFAAGTGWNQWVGRVLIPMVALGAPLLAALYARTWTRGLALGLAVVGLAPCVLLNVQKPLLVQEGSANVLSIDRIGQQTIFRTELRPLYRTLDRQLPGQPIGFVGSEDAWDYPLFGEHRERRVERMTAQQAENPELVRRKGLRAIVWGQVGAPPPRLGAVELAPGYFVSYPVPLPSSASASARVVSRSTVSSPSS